MPADFLLGLGTAAAGAGQLYSAFGGGSNRNAPSGNTVYWTNRGDMLEERRRQDRFIQRRVADATAAGVHPLFALGAATPAPIYGNNYQPPPSEGTDWASMGWGVGSMLAGAAQIRRARKAQLANVQADTATKKAEAAKEQALADNIKQQSALTGPPLQPGVAPQVYPTVPAQPLEPAVDWKSQLMGSRGPVRIQEWDDLLFSDIAELVRDAIRARSEINTQMSRYVRRLPLRKRKQPPLVKPKPHPAHSPKIWRKSWR